MTYIEEFSKYIGKIFKTNSGSVYKIIGFKDENSFQLNNGFSSDFTSFQKLINNGSYKLLTPLIENYEIY